MATEIALDVKIKTAESASTVKELKSSLKDLINELDKVPEGSEGFKKLQKSINDTEGKIGDLNDQFSTLRGSGVERLNSSVGLLSEGFTSFDTGKISAGFKGLGAAMSAIPIFLIIEGLKLLWDNFDKVTAFVNEFTKAVSDSESASESLARKLALVDEQNKHITESIKAQITALTGLKENEGEIIALKEKSFKIDIERQKLSLQVALAKQAEAEAEFNYIEQSLRFAGKEEEADKMRLIRTKEQRDATQVAIDALKTSIAGLAQFHNEQEQKKLDASTEANKKNVADYQKHLDDKKKAEEAHLNDLYQMHLNEVAKWNQMHIDELAAKKEQDKQDLINLNQSQLDAEAEYQNDSFVQEQQANENKEFAEQQHLERRKEGYKALQDSQLELTSKGLQAAQALTDLYFSHQLRQAKGNAAQETAIRKKAFNVNKAFGIANAVVDGVGAVQKALNNPYPLNIVLAVLSGVLAAANVAKIASTKFDDGGGSSGSAGDIGSSNISAPVIPQPNNTTTQLNPNGTQQGQGGANTGQPIVIKNEIVETQITEKQERVSKIKESATYG